MQGYAVTADLGKIADCKRTVQEAVEKMGGLDILVNRLGWM
jgi:NAD(P)-dependent dehydrogenase (short-subunit alcohol dehydrogenase family)